MIRKKQLCKWLVSLSVIFLLLSNIYLSHLNYANASTSSTTDQVATKIITFEESTDATRMKNVTIPNIISIKDVTVDNGQVSYQLNQETVSLSVSNGNGTTVQTGGSYIPADTKFVTNQSTQYYNQDGYSGTLNKYLYSGSYIPADTKTISVKKMYRIMPGKSPSKSIPYSDQEGYSGTLIMRSKTASSGMWYVTYAGSVTKPESDTRVYRYQGYVTKPVVDTRTYETTFSYVVTINYTEPVLDLSVSEGLTFDGVDDFVKVPNNPYLQLDMPFTVEVWFKAHSWDPNDHDRLINKGASAQCGQGYSIGSHSNNTSLTARYMSGKPDGAYDYDDYQLTETTVTPSVNEWHHVAYVVKTGDQKLYLDGMLVGQSNHTAPIAHGSEPLVFGAKYLSSNQFFDGVISEVRLWNRALTHTELIQQANQPLNGNEAGLVGHWLLSELTTKKVYDQTPKNNNGTVFGHPSPTMSIQADKITDMGIELSWSGLNKANSYKLMRNGQLIYSGNNRVFSDGILVADTNYTYSVIGKNTYGESMPVTASFNTKPGELKILSAPVNLSMTPITLNGHTKTSYGTFSESIVIKDTRKGSANWTLSVEAGPMENGDRQFPQKSLTLAPTETIELIKGKKGNKPLIINKIQTIDVISPVTLISSDGTGFGIYRVTFPENALNLTISPYTYVHTDGAPITYQTELVWHLN